MAELTTLGRYQLRRVLGKGAMGVVYEGFDPTLSRHVAIKTILQSAALDEETERSYAERFEREAKAVARLNHPHIIQVHDFGVQGDVAYLVMEFIRGRELRSYFVAGETFEPAECVRIMDELLDALDFAHEAGVVHRDVKPANVMLDAQRRVKLADFGVARVQDSDRSAAGTMVGTPAFMSPEQIQGLKIDRRTDVFSAGVILYQLLTGEQPFKGAGAWTVAKKIMQDDPPHPSSLVASVSPAFDGIVERALAKKAADRFANAREFAAALRGALGAAAGPASPVPPRAAPKPRPKPAAGSHASESELEFWRSIQNSGIAAEFESYLRKFPSGMYAELAQIKLERLRGGASDATIAIADAPAAPKKISPAVPAGIGVALLAAGAVAYLLLGRAPAPEQPDQAPAAPAAVPRAVELSPAEIEKIRKETEARIRREYADKSAAEQEKARAAVEKAAREKQLAAKVAAEKASAETAAQKSAAEKAASEKATAERAASERAAAEKASSEKVAAEKAAVERAAADKAAAEKAARERIAAEKASSEKAAAAKGGSALAQFIARHGADMVVDSEPADRSMRGGQVMYVNDKSCPPGEIKRVVGGNRAMAVPREYSCIKLAE